MTTPDREANIRAKRKWREDRNEPKLAIEIHGPRRDFDYSLFCVDHNTEAEECAAKWTAAIIDELETGEDATFRIVVREWREDDECCFCEPCEDTQ